MLSTLFDASSPARSAEDRFLLLQQHAATLGFDGLHYAIFTRRGDPTQSYRVIFSTLPAAYQEAYDDAGFLEDDPILRRAVSQFTPFSWFDCPEFRAARHHRRGRKPRARQILDLAAAFGFFDAIVVPTHATARDGRYQIGVVSLFGETASSTLPDWFRFQCQMLHEQVVAKDDADSLSPSPWVLPDRARHCLQWAARGKCRQDIAVILDISPASVDSYLHNALERLEATNTPQAVARAIREGLIFP